DEATFLREVRWTVENYNLAVLNKLTREENMRTFFQKAHKDRLMKEHGVNTASIKMRDPTTKGLGILLDQYGRMRGLGSQGQVHLILAMKPLPPMRSVYEVVFEKILNERVSTDPVNVAGRVMTK